LFLNKVDPPETETISANFKIFELKIEYLSPPLIFLKEAKPSTEPAKVR